MADLRNLEFPDDLRQHNLSAQELEPLTPQQQALAKDWNVIKRQSEWTMQKILVIHNLLVDHDLAIEAWKFWFKLTTMLTGGGAGLVAIIYWVAKQGGH